MIARSILFLFLLSLGACQTGRVNAPSSPPPSLPAPSSTVEAPQPIEKKRALLAKEYSGSYRPIAFKELPAWPGPLLEGSWMAWTRNCMRLKAMKPDADLGRGLHPRHLSKACQGAMRVNGKDAQAIKAYFETYFIPYAIEGEGKFTGYFEPIYNGSRKQTKKYRHPLYNPPRKANISRAEINKGKLAGHELVYLENPVDIFVLQIQGSALINLEGGGQMRVGYAGNNGATYVAIGKPMADAGVIARDKLSLQTITHYLKTHPKDAPKWMDRNPRYIFFREVKGKHSGPIGALGAPLTAGHSLAIDTKFTSLGLPLWLTTTWPRTKQPLQRLVIAQDKGAGIKGPVRGDLFWGSGDQAALDAGPMNEGGSYYILLPVE